MKGYQLALRNLKAEEASKGILLEFDNPKEQLLQAGVCKGSLLLQQNIKAINMETKIILEDIDFDFRELDSNFKHPVDDLKTRDFTVNGLYYDVSKGEIRDFNLGPAMEVNQGIRDLRDKVIRCINPFAVTFSDISRYLRAVRFEVTKSFTMEESLRDHFEKHAAKAVWKTSLKDLWAVIKEIGKILKSDCHFVDGMVAVMKHGLILGQPKQSKEDLELSNAFVIRFQNSS